MMKELEASLIEITDCAEAAHKRMKLIIRIEKEHIESFGWSDFPLILQPDVPSLAPTTFLSTILASGTRLTLSQEPHRPHAKRKDHPILCERNVDDTPSNTSFGWEDFPCIDDSDSQVSFRFEPSHSPLSFETRPNAVAASDDDSDSDNDEVPMRVPRSTSSKVDFAETVQVREYALTEGDHPSSLSLDWSHAPTEHVALQDDYYYAKSRPRRLSEWERRVRLAMMADDEDDVHAVQVEKC
jgi:hypothetical protein